jgi:hypothetical protein
MRRVHEGAGSGSRGQPRKVGSWRDIVQSTMADRALLPTSAAVCPQPELHLTHGAVPLPEVTRHNSIPSTGLDGRAAPTCTPAPDARTWVRSPAPRKSAHSIAEGKPAHRTIVICTTVFARPGFKDWREVIA